MEKLDQAQFKLYYFENLARVQQRQASRSGDGIAWRAAQ